MRCAYTDILKLFESAIMYGIGVLDLSIVIVYTQCLGRESAILGQFLLQNKVTIFTKACEIRMSSGVSLCIDIMRDSL